MGEVSFLAGGSGGVGSRLVGGGSWGGVSLVSIGYLSFLLSGVGDSDGEREGGSLRVGDRLGGDLDRDLCRLLCLRCS